MSGLPSPFTSAVVTHCGTVCCGVPTVKVTLETKLPPPLLVQIVNEALWEFAQTKSSRPSPLKSAAATECGELGVPKDRVEANTKPPVPSLVRTIRDLPVLLAVIRSGQPSLFTSADMT